MVNIVLSHYSTSDFIVLLYGLKIDKNRRNVSKNNILGQQHFILGEGGRGGGGEGLRREVVS